MIQKLSPQGRTLLFVLRNIVLAELFVQLIFALTGLASLGDIYRVPNSPNKLLQILEDDSNIADHPLRSISINSHANIFNRPVRVVEQRADYWGPRPHADTEANLEAIVEECRGSYDYNDKIGNIADCLSFLANNEDAYYHLPNLELRASAQNPHDAEYANSDGQRNTLQEYPQFEAPSLSSPGACPGPIVPYHTYWKGKATWRVEAFVKSYLFTQNLACSRLWIWLDADVNPNAVKEMMEDPLFVRFLPLVERGDILVKGWIFPTRVPIPNLQSQATSMSKASRDAAGVTYVDIKPRLMPFEPAAVSDAVRFVNLHLYGGVYLDMDMLLLRDLRPLLISKAHNWGERWGSERYPGDYNTAAMSLSANSELSTYFLLGAIRTGVHFHPRAVGRMIVQDGRDREFLKFENPAFDAIWLLFEWFQGKCTVPCLSAIDDVFVGQPFEKEWEAYEGEPLRPLGYLSGEEMNTKWTEDDDKSAVSILASIMASPEPAGSKNTLAALQNAGVVAEYKREEDVYAPSNRTMENFYKGAWAYHIHNRWSKYPEPSSWLDVIQQAHNDFFAGHQPNPYGEQWEGPSLIAYDFGPDYI